MPAERAFPAEVFPADPVLPELATACDPRQMLERFRKHLRPLADGALEIEDCALSSFRYRSGVRCILLYTLQLVDRGTGRMHHRWAHGAIYTRHGGDEDRAAGIFREIRAASPLREVGEDLFAFEPASFIPDLGMVVQVFPYDRRLSTLPLLATGPPPELETVLLARLGPGAWQAEHWSTEPIRYRPQLGAVLRYSVRARNTATGEEQSRRFYVKVYRDGTRTDQVLQTLMRNAPGAQIFAVATPIAQLERLQALALEEAPGTPLHRVLLEEEHSAEATVRRLARALADFNQGDAAAARRYGPEDEIAAVERAGRYLGWACPELHSQVETIVGAVARIDEAPAGPTHCDLKPEHILLDGDRFTLVDLDSFAAADPVLDPATFIARVVGLPYQLPMPQDRARAVAQAFADEYFARVPPSWARRLPLHYAGALLELAASLFRRQQPDWRDKVAALVREAEGSLRGRVW